MSADVTRDMAIAQDEIFGPVLTVMPFDTLDEAIAIANDTDLDKLQPHVPREAFEALYMLACGYELDAAIRRARQGDANCLDRLQT